MALDQNKANRSDLAHMLRRLLRSFPSPRFPPLGMLNLGGLRLGCCGRGMATGMAGPSGCARLLFCVKREIGTVIIGTKQQAAHSFRFRTRVRGVFPTYNTSLHYQLKHRKTKHTLPKFVLLFNEKQKLPRTSPG